MRFNTLLLIAASTTLANASFFRRSNLYRKSSNDITDVPDDLLDSEIISEKCQAAIENYYECYGLYAEDQVSYCKVMDTKKCKEFYKDPVSFLVKDGCKEEETEFISYINTSAESIRSLFCLTDESGEYCPISKEIDIINEDDDEEKYLQRVKENCKSNKCREGIIAFLENIKKMEDMTEEDIEGIDYQMKIFTSDECINYSGSSSGNNDKPSTPSTDDGEKSDDYDDSIINDSNINDETSEDDSNVNDDTTADDNVNSDDTTNGEVSDADSNVNDNTTADDNVNTDDTTNSEVSDADSNVNDNTTADDNVNSDDTTNDEASDADSNVNDNTTANDNVNSDDTTNGEVSDADSNVNDNTSADDNVNSDDTTNGEASDADSNVNDNADDSGNNTVDNTSGEASDDYGDAAAVDSVDGETSDDYGNDAAVNAVDGETSDDYGDAAGVDKLDFAEDSTPEEEPTSAVDQQEETSISSSALAGSIVGGAAIVSAGVFLWVKRSKRASLESASIV